MRQLLSLTICLFTAAALADEHETPPVRIGFANPVLIVKDLEESKRFYRDIMGYEVTGGGEITADVSRRTVGATRGQTTRSVYMRSAKLKDRDVAPSGIALVYIEDDGLPQMKRGDDSHDAVQGEIMLSLVVEGLGELLERMRSAGYTVLNKMEPSSSGKSMIASALDPNGIRLEMYEYLEPPKPEE